MNKCLLFLVFFAGAKKEAGGKSINHGVMGICREENKVSIERKLEE
jgi:hypothetical protein